MINNVPIDSACRIQIGKPTIDSACRIQIGKPTIETTIESNDVIKYWIQMLLRLYQFLSTHFYQRSFIRAFL